MRTFIILFFILLTGFPIVLKSQDIKDVMWDPVPPKFYPGGDSAFFAFVCQHIDKEKLNKLNITGTIFISLYIDTLGNASDIKIKRSLDQIADAECLRVIKLIPKWEPQSVYGKNNKVPWVLFIKLPSINKFCH